MLSPFKKPLEAILRKLARDNSIRTFHFVTYPSADADSDELDTEEVKPYELLPVPADYFRTHRLSDIVQQYCANPELVLGIASRVLVRDHGRFASREIVQLDMDALWPDGDPNLTDDGMPSVVADGAFRLCGQAGYVVRSSVLFGFLQNFHYYGKKVLPHEQWENLMLKAQRHALVGYIWPEYQLARGYSVLRVGTSKDKPQQPVPILQVAV